MKKAILIKFSPFIPLDQPLDKNIYLLINKNLM